MSIEETLTLDFADLRWLLISCPMDGCTTQIKFDATDQKNGVPSQCPSCNHTFDLFMRENLVLYRKIYDAWSKSKAVKVQTDFKPSKS